jgi:hypothetical protein
LAANLPKLERFSAVLDGQDVDWQSGKCHTSFANVPIFLMRLVIASYSNLAPKQQAMLSSGYNASLISGLGQNWSLAICGDYL